MECIAPHLGDRARRWAARSVQRMSSVVLQWRMNHIDSSCLIFILMSGQITLTKATMEALAEEGRVPATSSYKKFQYLKSLM